MHGNSKKYVALWKIFHTNIIYVLSSGEVLSALWLIISICFPFLNFISIFWDSGGGKTLRGELLLILNNWSWSEKCRIQAMAHLLPVADISLIFLRDPGPGLEIWWRWAVNCNIFVTMKRKQNSLETVFPRASSLSLLSLSLLLKAVGGGGRCCPNKVALGRGEGVIINIHSYWDITSITFRRGTDSWIVGTLAIPQRYHPPHNLWHTDSLNGADNYFEAD